MNGGTLILNQVLSKEISKFIELFFIDFNCGLHEVRAVQNSICQFHDLPFRFYETVTAKWYEILS